MTHPLVVAVDLDDVCADRLGMIAAALQAEGIDVGDSSPKFWDLSDWGVRDHGHYERLHYGCFIEADGYRRMAPLPGAVDALRALHLEGVRIRVLTGRLWTSEVVTRTLSDTASWLGHHGIPVDDIAFVTDKAAVMADVYVEDAPHFLQALHAAGRRTITYHKGYNSQTPGPRANNWQSVLDLLHSMTDERPAR